MTILSNAHSHPARIAPRATHINDNDDSMQTTYKIVVYYLSPSLHCGGRKRYIERALAVV